MISTLVLRGNEKTRKEMIALFHEAALAYLLNLDWKAIYKKAAISSIGAKKRFCNFWLSKTDKELLTAIDVYLETVKL